MHKHVRLPSNWLFNPSPTNARLAPQNRHLRQVISRTKLAVPRYAATIACGSLLRRVSLSAGANQVMSATTPQEVTKLLVAWSDGDASALNELLPLVEFELHQLAHRYMSRARPDHTLQTTALVNEAYLKLIDQ